MALPTMDLPTYELEVPSTRKKIKYRPFLVKEEKVLLMAMETEDDKTIRDATLNLLKSCIQSRIKIENLATFDLEYIFLNIRAVSVGEVVQLMITCDDDGETQVKYNLNLTDVAVIFPEGHSSKIMLDDTTGVIMKYPSFDRFVEGNITDKEMNAESVTEIIAESIDQIFQGEDVYDSSTTSKKEFIQFVDSLTNTQLENIQKFFETAPRLEHTITVPNPNTGVESEYTLRGLQSFFG
tara:strand:+ start:472 stop:1185 length:714 start_codon:yes stop_codon:yes gene_type:complete